MATLRVLILARIADLNTQIATARHQAHATIRPLQSAVDDEQDKMVRFAPWLDLDETVAPTQISALLLSPN